MSLVAFVFMVFGRAWLCGPAPSWFRHSFKEIRQFFFGRWKCALVVATVQPRNKTVLCTYRLMSGPGPQNYLFVFSKLFSENNRLTYKILITNQFSTVLSLFQIFKIFYKIPAIKLIQWCGFGSLGLINFASRLFYLQIM